RVTVQPLGVREPDDFDAAFSAMTQHRPDALFLVTDALTTLNRKRVIEFALTHRIPAMYEFSTLVRDGGLMSYGADFNENYRRASAHPARAYMWAIRGARAALRVRSVGGPRPGARRARRREPVLPHHQPQDRQGPRAHLSSLAARPG